MQTKQFSAADKAISVAVLIASVLGLAGTLALLPGTSWYLVQVWITATLMTGLLSAFIIWIDKVYGPDVPGRGSFHATIHSTITFLLRWTRGFVGCVFLVSSLLMAMPEGSQVALKMLQ